MASADYSSSPTATATASSTQDSPQATRLTSPHGAEQSFARATGAERAHTPSPPPQPPRRATTKAFLESTPSRKRKRRRMATVYDAVAGYITTSGFALPTDPPPVPVSTRDRLSHSSVALPPSEVLFSRLRAPDRIAENDLYAAHEALPAAPSPRYAARMDADGSEVAVAAEAASGVEEEYARQGPDEAMAARLPDSDLLKALHAYAARLYSCVPQSARRRGRESDGPVVDPAVGGSAGSASWRSLDETALLALGILVEELARACVLGDTGTGDMVFAEGEEVDEGAHAGTGVLSLMAATSASVDEVEAQGDVSMVDAESEEASPPTSSRRGSQSVESEQDD